MATVTNYDGDARPGVVEVLGQFAPIACFKVVPSSSEASAGTLSVTITQLVRITGAMVQVLDSGNNVATSDIDVTWSGNVLTLANGSSFSLAATQNIYCVVWGIPKA
ncbi:MAG: hypothetical protein D6726_02910 [Nitrospirae bacterium]|nr:MAG: hypothetical protein D6726_02910 [Nitrospirota bacterium]